MSDFEIIHYDPVSKSSRSGGIELLDEWDANGAARIWLNICGEADDDVIETVTRYSRSLKRLRRHLVCQLNQELASDLLNTHLSLASHRLNQVMRVLTITTVIFLPLALLAGIYGMNFQFIPELTWHYGYFGVLATMAAIVVVLVVVFRRRGWL